MAQRIAVGSRQFRNAVGHVDRAAAGRFNRQYVVQNAPLGSK